jgi:hypothetical protein
MTIHTLYRWVDTAAKKFKRPPAPFSLFPVKIEPAGVLSYNVSRDGPALVRESLEHVAPGDCGCYDTDGSVPQCHFQFRRDPSFVTEQAVVEELYSELAAMSSHMRFETKFWRGIKGALSLAMSLNQLHLS